MSPQYLTDRRLGGGDLRGYTPNAVEKRKISSPFQESNSNSLVIWSIA
jgi:hypothetical protein